MLTASVGLAQARPNYIHIERTRVEQLCHNVGHHPLMMGWQRSCQLVSILCQPCIHLVATKPKPGMCHTSKYRL